MIFQMLRWWYGPGWLQALQRITGWAATVGSSFSLSLLLRTLFAPWRRMASPKGRTLEDKMHAMVDNAVSRAIGFTIRFFVLVTAALMMLGALLVGGIMALIWPLLPLLTIIFFVMGIIG